MTELPVREDFGDYGSWPGRAVLDPSGRRLGEVREIYLDDATDRPEWVLVELEGDAPRFVPLADATVADEAIRVAQDPERIGAAPALEPSKELTREEERRLYSHYGLRYSDEESDSLLPDPDQPSAGAEAGDGENGGADRPEAAAPEVRAGEAAGVAQPRLRRFQGAEPVLEAGAGAALPPPGATSEPEDTGPMIPPRPEPVAPSPPEPRRGGPLALLRKRPVPVIVGAAGAVAAIALIVLRRR